MFSNVLMSLLPGVREVRTPLTAGYIWLTLGWLAWGSHAPTVRPTAGMFAMLWDVGMYIGKGGLFVVASFAAFLVGSLLEVNPLKMWQHGGRPQWINRLRDLVRVPKMQWLGVYAVSPEAQRDLLEYTREEYSGLGDDVDRALTREEQQLATRLQAANVDLYGRYERLLAESSFRINVTPPLVLLLLLILWESAAPRAVQLLLTGVLALAAFRFLRQGVRRAIRSRDIIVQSVVAEVVTPRFLSRQRESQPKPPS